MPIMAEGGDERAQWDLGACKISTLLNHLKTSIRSSSLMVFKRIIFLDFNPMVISGWMSVIWACSNSLEVTSARESLDHRWTRYLKMGQTIHKNCVTYIREPHNSPWKCRLQARKAARAFIQLKLRFCDHLDYIAFKCLKQVALVSLFWLALQWCFTKRAMFLFSSY